MRYTRLGSTGLEVSAITLGCMSFGEPTRGGQPWSLAEDDSRKLIKQALESGVNFFDTANVYSDGSSEEVTGAALKDFAKREEVVIATKVFNRMRPGPNGAGLSRKAILAEIDNSLLRLGVDYVDLYQIHRWDYLTPITETLEALNDVVKAGKARYIGASSMYAWQFAKALRVSRENGWARFSTMQDHYNLLYREEEREMLPLCLDEGVGIIPWSPLARGLLARDWDEKTVRADTDDVRRALYTESNSDRAIVDRVGELATKHEVSRASVALAWVSSRPAVNSPIIGATKPHHISDAVASLKVKLESSDLCYLEEPYTPQVVRGFV